MVCYIDNSRDDDVIMGIFMHVVLVVVIYDGYHYVVPIYVSYSSFNLRLLKNVEAIVVVVVSMVRAVALRIV